MENIIDIPLAGTGFTKLVFNSHKTHNPYCDILEGHYRDGKSFITYGVNLHDGSEFMEYYSGSNYVNVPEWFKRGQSYSRHYKPDKIPAIHMPYWLQLKMIYHRSLCYI